MRGGEQIVASHLVGIIISAIVFAPAAAVVNEDYSGALFVVILPTTPAA